MTDTEVNTNSLAQRIAARGQEALLERMRTAYREAAAAHAGLISLDPERIEEMAQAAADRADGLQWRRALAGVAAEELGVSEAEALTRPEVAQAQMLLGAPAYEQSLRELLARPVPEEPAAQEPSAWEAPVASQQEPAAWEAPGAAEPIEQEPISWEASPGPAEPIEQEPISWEATPGPAEPVEQEHAGWEAPVAAEQEPAGWEAPGPAELAEQEPSDTEAPAMEEPAYDLTAVPTVEHETVPVYAEEHAESLEEVEADDVVLELLPEPEPVEYETYTAEQPQDLTLQVPAIHLGGVANLPTKRGGLFLRLSVDGLDILQGEENIIGRLIWEEIESLDVPAGKSRRRQRDTRARLVVRTAQGDASFDVPEVADDELRDRVEALVRQYGRH